MAASKLCGKCGNCRHDVPLASLLRLNINSSPSHFRLLNTSQGSILDDETLVNALQSSKKTSEEVTEQLEIAEQTETKIDTARDVRLKVHPQYYLHMHACDMHVHHMQHTCTYMSLCVSLPFFQQESKSQTKYIIMDICKSSLCSNSSSSSRRVLRHILQ